MALCTRSRVFRINQYRISFRNHVNIFFLKFYFIYWSKSLSSCYILTISDSAGCDCRGAKYFRSIVLYILLCLKPETLHHWYKLERNLNYWTKLKFIQGRKCSPRASSYTQWIKNANSNGKYSSAGIRLSPEQRTSPTHPYNLGVQKVTNLGGNFIENNICII